MGWLWDGYGMVMGWLSKVIYGYLWLSMVIYGYLWLYDGCLMVVRTTFVFVHPPKSPCHPG